MKKFLLLILACLVLSSSAFASSTTCPTGAYTLYLVMNFSCVSGALTFNNFGYSNSASGTSAIPASAITVTPQTTSGNEGFQFASGWSVISTSGGGSTFQDSLITFTVSSASPAITDLHLFFNGSVIGTGSSSVAETYCLGHAVVGCPMAQSITVTNPPQNFNAAAFFSPQTSVDISKDINVTSGSNGQASISQVINTFSNPEPLSFVLLGSGLLGLGLLRKRLHKR